MFSSFYLSKNSRLHFGFETDLILEEDNWRVVEGAISSVESDDILFDKEGRPTPLERAERVGVWQLDPFTSSYFRWDFNPSVAFQFVGSKNGAGFKSWIWLGPGISFENVVFKGSRGRYQLLDDRVDWPEGQNIYMPIYSVKRGIDFQIKGGIKLFYQISTGWQFGLNANVQTFSFGSFPLNQAILIGKSF